MYNSFSRYEICKFMVPKKESFDYSISDLYNELAFLENCERDVEI